MEEQQKDEKFPFEEGPNTTNVVPESDNTTSVVQKDEEPPPPPKHRADKRGVAMEHGLLVPQHSGELMAVAKTLLESRALPRQFENVPQVAMGMQMLRQLSLPDIVGLRQLAIINGAFTIWGELPLALCWRSGLLVAHREFLFNREYKEINFENRNLEEPPWGAFCSVTRKVGVSLSALERVFTVEDAKTAGLWQNPKKEPWVKYPRRMLQMKGRGWALKDQFPDILMGVAQAEYDFDTVVEPSGHAAPAAASSAADDLNKEFLGDAE